MPESAFRNSEKWKELHGLVGKLCFLRGRFVLSSGQVSDTYFDCRKITLHARGSLLIAELIHEIITGLEAGGGGQISAVGGPTMGADPIAAAVALRSAQLDRNPVQAFIVRKESKKHGTSLDIENNPPEGSGVVVVEDVVTTGGSVFKALEKVEQAGLTVRAVVCIVDREQGGGDKLAERYPFFPLFLKSDFS